MIVVKLKAKPSGIGNKIIKIKACNRKLDWNCNMELICTFVLALIVNFIFTLQVDRV